MYLPWGSISSYTIVLLLFCLIEVVSLSFDLTYNTYNIPYVLYGTTFITTFWGFAAIRLAVLDEPESEEEVIFNQRPRPPQTGWSLDTEDTNPEDTRHHRDSRGKIKVTGNAPSDVAFSSPLVR